MSVGNTVEPHQAYRRFSAAMDSVSKERLKLGPSRDRPRIRDWKEPCADLLSSSGDLITKHWLAPVNADQSEMWCTPHQMAMKSARVLVTRASDDRLTRSSKPCMFSAIGPYTSDGMPP